MRLQPAATTRSVIDSDLAPGRLTYGELFIPRSHGSGGPDLHSCLPPLAGERQCLGHGARGVVRRRAGRGSGSAFGAHGIRSRHDRLHHWLAQNEARLGKIDHGLVIGLLGDPGPLTYKRSQRSDAMVDRVAEYVVRETGPQHRVIDFHPYGYDERQLCSPGFNLPVGRLTRSPNEGYPEYHSSADDLSLIDPQALAQSYATLARIVHILDANGVYRNLSPKCEPQLGKRGLYRLDRRGRAYGCG